MPRFNKDAKKIALACQDLRAFARKVVQNIPTKTRSSKKLMEYYEHAADLCYVSTLLEQGSFQKAWDKSQATAMLREDLPARFWSLFEE